MIDSFTNEYAFLSNFYLVDIKYQGFTYPSSEHAYQAAKTLDSYEKSKFTSRSISPAQSKKMGRNIKLRSDWEHVKLKVMEDILRIKFAQGTPLSKQLMATGNQQLIEGNWWNDTYWGVCRGKGENHLGKLLMKIRKELIDKPISQKNKT